MKGLSRRGHTIIENSPIPKDFKADIIISPTFGPLSFINIWRYKRKYNCACVQHAHTTLDDMVGGFLPESLVPFAEIYLRNLYKFSEILITPSNFSKGSLIEIAIPTKPSIYPVSNGVDLTKFSYTDEKRARFRTYLSETHGISEDKTVVLGVGVVWERKGIDVFHHLAKQFPDYEFVWVGNTIGTQNIVDKYSKLDNITFTGFVDDIVEAYCGGDVFFFPSRAENQGIPLLEAAACRLPILCRALPTYDWLEDGVHCIKENTTEGFKKSLKDIVDNGELREKLKANALENVQNHDIEHVLDIVEDIYRKSIKVRKRLLRIVDERKDKKK
jgi:glycosyltransferase involved in cell wall biosynthesis